jgi:hypothetical protein
MMVAQSPEATICLMMRRFWAMMIAFALLIVPVGMIGGAAEAHQQPAHSTMSADCHEGGAASKDKKPKGVGMSAECALACAALPASMARVVDRLPTAPLPRHPMSAAYFAGASPESDDPPPRA